MTADKPMPIRYGMAMDTRRLRYFVTIAEQGSITGAAGVLGVAQPALSLTVKTLEDQLGTQLLRRSHAGVVPTEAGALLVERARHILTLLDQTQDDIRSLGRDPAGVVRVGLPSTISAIIALPLIEAARDAYPNIRITVAEAMSGFITTWLDNGQIDLALLYGPGADQTTQSQFLLQEELVVVWQGPSGHPDTMSLRDLADVPLVLPSPEHGLRQQVDKAMAHEGLTPTLSFEIDSYHNIKRFVSMGYGASILPAYAIYEEIGTGAFHRSRITRPALRRDLHMVYPAQQAVSHAQQAVRQLIPQVIGNLVADGTWFGAVTAEPRQP